MKFVESVKYVSRKSLVFSFLLGLLLVTGCTSSAKMRQICVTGAWADSRVDTVINSAWKFNKAGAIFPCLLICDKRIRSYRQFQLAALPL